MSETRRHSPGRWLYALSALLVFAALLLVAGKFYRNVRRLPLAVRAAYAAYDLDRLKQVVVPGRVELTLTRTGAYAVYYEHRSVVDGVAYTSEEKPPDLICSLTRQATGRDIPLVPDYVVTNRYLTRERERVGTLLLSTTIETPGTYSFACDYEDGSRETPIVLAFGHNLTFEFLVAVVRAAGAVLGSLAFGAAVTLAGLFLFLVAWRTRRES